MAKVDKSQYTKEEWKIVREQRRAVKEAKRAEKNKQPSKKPESPPIIPRSVKPSSRNISRPKEIEKSTAFVVGNGTSRSTIDLESLKNKGIIYGCNALYREFDPHYLIAVDTKMILEINKSKVQHKIPVWTNRNKMYAKFTGFNYFEPSKGWSSGPTALWKASEDGADEIYILGFDYKGIGENQDKVNNMYSGTFNYKKTGERATYFGNWLKQTVTTIQKFPKKRYIRVIGSSGYVPKELSKLSNLKHISVEDFKEIFEK